MLLDTLRLFKICWHNYQDVKTQISKNRCYGFPGTELPGYRVVQKCSKCGKIKYERLSLHTPYVDLYNDILWK